MKKLSYKEVKLRFENEGYTLLSKAYKNNRTKLETVCPEGHVYFTTYTNFASKNRRCAICGTISTSKHLRLSFTEVKETFESVGYTLVSTEYENTDQKLSLLCSKGHKLSMSLHNFKSGWRCLQCRAIRQSVLYSGENHSQWKGGVSLQGYCSAWRDKEYKEFIRQRDGYMCRNPYCYKNDDILHIHHIDYNKQNCHPNNLITVCRSCNARANSDRKWHTEWYQTIIKNSNN
jgi:hypothetical protein